MTSSTQPSGCKTPISSCCHGQIARHKIMVEPNFVKRDILKRHYNRANWFHARNDLAQIIKFSCFPEPLVRGVSVSQGEECHPA